MKEWLNTPVTYGCLIRLLLICVFICLLLASAIDVAFNIGGSRWTAASAAILAVLGIIIGPVGQWFVSLSTDEPEQAKHSPSTSTDKITFEQAFEQFKKQEETKLKALSNQETGTLIVSTSRENRGVTVYLLPREEFLKYRSGQEREASKQKRIGTITCLRFGQYPLYVTWFRGLRPGRYNTWAGWDYGKDRLENHIVQIDKGTMSILELDWTK